MPSDVVLQVEDLQVQFSTSRGIVKAVDGVSFYVRKGEALGLVGESGCGKSVTCLSILRLLPPGGRIVGGAVRMHGQNLLALSDNEMRKIRGAKISMILQDPMTSLDPVFTVGEQIIETLYSHRASDGGRRFVEQAIDLLRLVRIPSPEVRLRNFPHQMSGGMRQRIVAAVSLASQPELLLADEPTTSLDVTIQLQFLTLLKEIQEQLGMAMILVTHDLGIVARACHRVAVMYAGRIVETGTVQDIFRNPAHPYTRGLLQSVPKLGVTTEELPTIEGQPPDLADLPQGCPFRPRCPQAMTICAEEYPPEDKVGDGHYVHCWTVRRG